MKIVSKQPVEAMTSMTIEAGNINTLINVPMKIGSFSWVPLQATYMFIHGSYSVM